MGAMRALWISSLLAASLAAFGLTGCTIYGEKKPPTLKSTTSAEQYERIFWSTVKAKNWQQVPGMLAANVMYSAGGKILSKDQVIPYLQAANITDFTITGMVVKPNEPFSCAYSSFPEENAASPTLRRVVIGCHIHKSGTHPMTSRK